MGVAGLVWGYAPKVAATFGGGGAEASPTIPWEAMHGVEGFYYWSAKKIACGKRVTLTPLWYRSCLVDTDVIMVSIGPCFGRTSWHHPQASIHLQTRPSIWLLTRQTLSPRWRPIPHCATIRACASAMTHFWHAPASAAIAVWVVPTP